MNFRIIIISLFSYTFFASFLNVFRCTGLDGLKERAAAYYAQGARFAKWRAVLQITSDGCPSALSLQENAWGLARYARAVQESGMSQYNKSEVDAYITSINWSTVLLFNVIT